MHTRNFKPIEKLDDDEKRYIRTVIGQSMFSLEVKDQWSADDLQSIAVMLQVPPNWDYLCFSVHGLSHVQAASFYYHRDSFDALTDLRQTIYRLIGSR